MVKVPKLFKEKECAEFFLRCFNQRYNFDYFLSLAEPETRDSDVDFYGLSNSGKPKIKLQLTICDDYPIDRIKKGEIDGEYSHTNWIINAILKKEKYPPEQKKELILLVHPYNFAPFEGGINISKLRMLFSQSIFKGIYYVCPPRDSVKPHYWPIKAVF